MYRLICFIAFLTTISALGQTDCPNTFDGNGDGAVTIPDLLDILVVFGDLDSDLDGVWDSLDDCTDAEACNYASVPTETCAYIDAIGICGGDCEGDGDGDGICDNVDTCIGILDVCGVCNGPGPTEMIVEDITILYDSVYAENIDTWLLYEIGQDTTFGYTCEPPVFGECGDPLSYQGYNYATVLIGEQCWFAENLRNADYNNGEAIPTNLSASNWTTANFGATVVYGEYLDCSNNSPVIDACDSSRSLEEYGRLYNWYAVNDSRGLCPSNWHVPTDEEWSQMTIILGDEALAGSMMKAEYGWYGDGNGTNSIGFSALPGGSRDNNVGNFFGSGKDGYWWSSSLSGSLAGYGYLSSSSDSFFQLYSNRHFGFSVRCVRDAE